MLMKFRIWYITMDALKTDIDKRPNAYTEWLKICFDKAPALYKDKVILHL